jgi:hypothetical protein
MKKSKIDPNVQYDFSGEMKVSLPHQLSQVYLVSLFKDDDILTEISQELEHLSNTFVDGDDVKKKFIKVKPLLQNLSKYVVALLAKDKQYVIYLMFELLGQLPNNPADEVINRCIPDVYKYTNLEFNKHAEVIDIRKYNYNIMKDVITSVFNDGKKHAKDLDFKYVFYRLDKLMTYAPAAPGAAPDSRALAKSVEIPEGDLPDFAGLDPARLNNDVVVPQEITDWVTNGYNVQNYNILVDWTIPDPAAAPGLVVANVAALPYYRRKARSLKTDLKNKSIKIDYIIEKIHGLIVVSKADLSKRIDEDKPKLEEEIKKLQEAHDQAIAEQKSIPQTASQPVKDAAATKVYTTGDSVGFRKLSYDQLNRGAERDKTNIKNIEKLSKLYELYSTYVNMAYEISRLFDQMLERPENNNGHDRVPPTDNRNYSIDYMIYHLGYFQDLIEITYLLVEPLQDQANVQIHDLIDASSILTDELHGLANTLINPIDARNPIDRVDKDFLAERTQHIKGQTADLYETRKKVNIYYEVCRRFYIYDVFKINACNKLITLSNIGGLAKNRSFTEIQGLSRPAQLSDRCYRYYNYYIMNPINKLFIKESNKRTYRMTDEVFFLKNSIPTSLHENECQLVLTLVTSRDETIQDDESETINLKLLIDTHTPVDDNTLLFTNYVDYPNSASLIRHMYAFIGEYQTMYADKGIIFFPIYKIHDNLNAYLVGVYEVVAQTFNDNFADYIDDNGFIKDLESLKLLKPYLRYENDLKKEPLYNNFRIRQKLETFSSKLMNSTSIDEHEEKYKEIEGKIKDEFRILTQLKTNSKIQFSLISDLQGLKQDWERYNTLENFKKMLILLKESITQLIGDKPKEIATETSLVQYLNAAVYTDPTQKSGELRQIMVLPTYTYIADDFLLSNKTTKLILLELSPYPLYYDD